MYWAFKKILCIACLPFNCFLVIKGILKALFSSIHWLLNFSDSPQNGWNSRKRYTLRLLSKCLVRSTLLPIGAKVPPNLLIPSLIPLDGILLAQLYTYVLANLLQNEAKFIQNWLQISKIIWGIWITSDKHWKVQKVEIQWVTFV